MADTMTMCEWIQKKKRGEALTYDELNRMITGYVSGDIPDYQMAAMLMAICFQGMQPAETKDLTLVMARSGDMLNLSGIEGIKVDKHSTGGVGDKTSLVLLPMVAALGIPVAKMSGRGLSHTGGTIDKLESITGFSADLSQEAFLHQVNTIHLAIAGQTANLAPADKLLYALRDVTGTVDQISLIASSIMSKKLAAGADAIVLDVKVGDGAFMKSMDDARALAREMLAIGTLAGKEMYAVISNMNQPLGFAVGNALELREAVDTLQGHGPSDLTELVLTLGSYMAIAAKKADTPRAARRMLEETLQDGSAFAVFRAFVKAQGGDTSEIEDTSLLLRASCIEEVRSVTSGYIAAIQTEEIGRICLMLGGGRKKKGDAIDPSVGVVLQKKTGDYVKAGEVLSVIYANDASLLADASARLRKAFSFSHSACPGEDVIKEIITDNV